MTANAATAVTYVFDRTAEKLALPYALIMALSSRARRRTASLRGFSAVAAIVSLSMLWAAVFQWYQSRRSEMGWIGYECLEVQTDCVSGW